MNTLTMNILEQTREIGWLRVMGMSKKHTGPGHCPGDPHRYDGSVHRRAGGHHHGVCDRLGQHAAACPRGAVNNLHYDLFLFNFGVCVLIALVSAILPGNPAIKVRMITAVAYE